eukprot:gnl/Chilomastix_caulleri/635.p1 GENE.gnl/Chilomastix_caulleri/635~~gnl/Chilomastix_caulleri/635.p1  ORF type:complete len:249 (+),score=100.61 gnl/Chilomastix_caulleri/635:83-829(+)
MIPTQAGGCGMVYQPLGFINQMPPVNSLYSAQRVTQFIPSQNQPQGQVQGVLPPNQLNRNIKPPTGTGPMPSSSSTSKMQQGSLINNQSQPSMSPPSSTLSTSPNGFGPLNPMFSMLPQHNQMPCFVNPFPGVGSVGGVGGMGGMGGMQNDNNIQQGQYFFPPYYYVPTTTMNGSSGMNTMQGGGMMQQPGFIPTNMSSMMSPSLSPSTSVGGSSPSSGPQSQQSMQMQADVLGSTTKFQMYQPFNHQ